MYPITLRNLVINYMDELYDKGHMYRDAICFFNSHGNEKFIISYENIKNKDTLQLIFRNYEYDDVFIYDLNSMDKLLEKLLEEINYNHIHIKSIKTLRKGEIYNSNNIQQINNTNNKNNILFMR